MLDKHGLQVDPALVEFVENQVLPGSGVEAEAFWTGLAGLFERFVPVNRALLARRDELQARIDDWYRTPEGLHADGAATAAFLRDIGYLVPEPEPFSIDPPGIDDEVARTAGPQLVVPVLNARFVLNAANARWGSLYDALYGTDALPGKARGPGYDAERGAAVIARARAFLDEALPLANGSWVDWDGAPPVLRHPERFVGRNGEHLLFRHHGLHIEVVINRQHPVGAGDRAGVADVLLESALTTIVDFEDSVAAVDAADRAPELTAWG